jgi:membrane fusion protein (multidrug efflux system)
MPDHNPFPASPCSFSGLAIAALAGCSRTSVETPGTSKAAAAAPEKEVGTVTLKHETLALSTELPGRTAAPVIAEIRPQVGGILKERLFTEGSQVKAGQVLYQLDPARCRRRTPARRPACARPSRPWPRRAPWRGATPSS